MTDASETSMKSKLEQLLLEDADFRKLEHALKVFCPFEALGVERVEIRHANFLASMLDPYRPHGLGDKFLRSVLDTLLARSDAPAGFSRLRLHLMDLDDVEVRREWQHIDLLLVLGEQRLVVVFELKIDALESDGQLGRYREAVEARWPKGGDGGWTHLYFFLTPDGAEPTDPNWRAISYDEVIDAVDGVLANIDSDGLAVAMLRAYAAMLRRNVMQDEELAAIAQALWQRHKEALEYLVEQRPDEVGSLGEAIRDRAAEIGKAASLDAITLIPDDSLRTMTRFAIAQWDTLPGMHTGSWTRSKRLILIEIHVSANRAQAALYLGPGEQSNREAYFRAVQPEITKAADKLTSKWKLLCRHELLSAAELDGDYDQEAIIAILKQRFKTFVESKLPKFDARLRQMVVAG